MKIGSHRRKSWSLYAGVVAVAVLVRAAIDLATPLVPKINGAYYLLQVRAQRETGSLAFADFPLVFMLEAGLAWLLALLGVGRDAAIVVAVKAVDIVLPSLTAIPVMILADQIRRPGETRRWPVAAVGIFSVLSWSPLVMTGDFQKNAIGMLVMACTIAAAHGALTRGGALRWVETAAFLGLAGLSHAGAFAATIAFMAIAGCIAAAVARPGRWKTVLIAIGILTGAAVALGVVMRVIDPRRFSRLAALVLEPSLLLRKPVLAGALGGAVGPLDLANCLLVSAISALGLVTLARQWRTSPRADRAIVGAASVLALALASPLIGAEWAERLSLMAYLPGLVAFAYALRYIRTLAVRKTAAIVACVTCFAGLAVSIHRLGAPSIPVESIHELESLGTLVKDPGSTLIIARHGLEWWAAWILRAKVAQEFDLDPAVWGEYTEVFMLRQKQMEGPTLPGGPNGAGAKPFPEVRLPDDAETVHDGRYFLLARAPSAPVFYPLARPER